MLNQPDDVVAVNIFASQSHFTFLNLLFMISDDKYSLNEYAINDYDMNDYAINEYAINEYAINEYAILNML